jgi:hypothetical protein
VGLGRLALRFDFVDPVGFEEHRSDSIAAGIPGDDWASFGIRLKPPDPRRQFGT